jgi:hypothetical protein
MGGMGEMGAGLGGGMGAGAGGMDPYAFDPSKFGGPQG